MLYKLTNLGPTQDISEDQKKCTALKCSSYCSTSLQGQKMKGKIACKVKCLDKTFNEN